MTKNLKQIRTGLKKSQMEMARRVGVSLMAYQLWERQVSCPNEENEIKLKAVIEEMKMEQVLEELKMEMEKKNV